MCQEPTISLKFELQNQLYPKAILLINPKINQYRIKCQQLIRHQIHGEDYL
jgi:hypothetical protein